MTCSWDKARSVFCGLSRGGQLRRACGLVGKSPRNEAGSTDSCPGSHQIAIQDALAIDKTKRCRLPPGHLGDGKV